MTGPDLATVRFDADGLIPAVVQDMATGDVLMLAYMNQDALRLTRETGRAHFWSRSRSKLWRKGETSGNEQIVAEIRINCEQNSLLLRVSQLGAVCHDGFDTCYYRTLGGDDALTVVRERVFDPRDVYGTSADPDASANALAAAARLQFGAYVFLRDHDLTAVSSTSRGLRAEDECHQRRIAEELEELAGVIEGSHRHVDPQSDARLEASQVMYWILLDVIRAGLTWSQFRTDTALATEPTDQRAEDVAALLRADARCWRSQTASERSSPRAAHATLALVSRACRVAGVDPLDAVEYDLNALRAREYLAPYFAEHAR